MATGECQAIKEKNGPMLHLHVANEEGLGEDKEKFNNGKDEIGKFLALTR